MSPISLWDCPQFFLQMWWFPLPTSQPGANGVICIFLFFHASPCVWEPHLLTALAPDAQYPVKGTYDLEILCDRSLKSVVTRVRNEGGRSSDSRCPQSPCAIALSAPGVPTYTRTATERKGRRSLAHRPIGFWGRPQSPLYFMFSKQSMPCSSSITVQQMCAGLSSLEV